VLSLSPSPIHKASDQTHRRSIHTQTGPLDNTHTHTRARPPYPPHSNPSLRPQAPITTTHRHRRRRLLHPHRPLISLHRRLLILPPRTPLLSSSSSSNSSGSISCRIAHGIQGAPTEWGEELGKHDGGEGTEAWTHPVDPGVLHLCVCLSWVVVVGE
jgi:hypothetical protein